MYQVDLSASTAFERKLRYAGYIRAEIDHIGQTIQLLYGNRRDDFDRTNWMHEFGHNTLRRGAT